MELYRAEYRVQSIRNENKLFDHSGFLSLLARELCRSIIFFSNTRNVPGGKRIFDWTGDEISLMFVNGIFNESSRRERIADRK